MAYWIIALSWSVAGTILFWILLSIKWDSVDMFDKLSLKVLKAFHPIPGDPEMGFLDLQFSVLRHAVVFLASSILIYFVKKSFLLHMVLLLNLWYSWLSVSRYRHRKKDLKETAERPDSQATVQMLTFFVKVSLYPAVHAIISALLLYFLYAIRP